MLTRCHTWDLGPSAPPIQELTNRLQEISHTEAILVSSKTSFPEEWNQVPHCLLINGPSKHMRVYFSKTTEGEPTLDHLRKENAEWLSTFRELRERALADRPWREQAAQLQSSIQRRLHWEETKIYPALDKFLLSNRPTREMFYEHEGIRRYLPGLIEALAYPRGDRGWEKFSLDLIHLLEHHIEHEERGLYPVYERLVSGGKVPGQVQ